MELDHTIVPVRDKEAASRLMARVMGWEFLGVRGSQGHVRVNGTLVVRFDDKDADSDIPRLHLAFHVADDEFDAVLGRLGAEEIAYGTSSRDKNMRWDDLNGGRRIFFATPDAHSIELMTAPSPPGLDA